MRGFSVFGMMFWGVMLGVVGLYASAMWPVYSAYWKVQDTFDGIARHLSEASKQDIRERLPKLLWTQYLNPESLPAEFYDHLEIEADADGHVRIESSYHVTVWFLGEVKQMQSDDHTSDLHGLDQLRDLFKHEVDFRPYAESVKRRSDE